MLSEKFQDKKDANYIIQNKLDEYAKSEGFLEDLKIYEIPKAFLVKDGYLYQATTIICLLILQETKNRVCKCIQKSYQISNYQQIHIYTNDFICFVFGAKL